MKTDSTVHQRGGSTAKRSSPPKRKEKEANKPGNNDCCYSTPLPPVRVMDKKTNEPGLKSYHEVPAFLQYNRHVLTGYRVSYRHANCPRSHDETLNIWTHLLGALIFVALFHPTIRYLHEPTTTDVVLFGIYFACAVTTMICSAVFHLFNCTSPGAYKRLATLDYSGISLLIVGSYLPLVYWGFHCVPWWRDVYMATISAFGVIGLALSWIPYFSQPHTRFLRTSLYLFFGWFSLIPVGHLVYMDGSFWFVWRIGRFVLLMGIIYSVAAAIYVSQIPERWAPGMFDYSCQSHVIWHVLVFLAALVQVGALMYCHGVIPEHSCPAGYGDLPAA